MTTEDDVRAALLAATEGHGASPPGWDEIAARGRRAARLRSLALSGGASLVAAAVLAGALLATGALDRDPGQRVVADDGATTTTAAPTTTEAPTTTSTALASYADPAEVGIWPFTSREEVDRYESRAGEEHADPSRVAAAFATVYLGMRDVTATQQGADDVAPEIVDVRIDAGRRRAATVVTLTRVAEQAWTVIAARAESIVVDAPEQGATVGSPLALAGRARAYEGTVQVEVRDEMQTSGSALGRTFVTGSGGEDLGPFEGSVAFDAPKGDVGAVVFLEESAEDGSPLAATVVRVRFRSA